VIHADAENCALACKHSTTKPETDLVSQLIRQSQDQGSALMCGKHTRKTTSVSRAPKAYRTAALSRIESKRGDLLALDAEGHSEATAVEEGCPTVGLRDQGVHAMEEREAQELLDLDGKYKEDAGLLDMQMEEMDEHRLELELQDLRQLLQTQTSEAQAHVAELQDRLDEQARGLEEREMNDNQNLEVSQVNNGKPQLSSVHDLSQSPKISADQDAPAVPLGEIVSPRLSEPRTSLANAAEESGRQIQVLSVHDVSRSPKMSTDRDAPAVPLGEIVSPRLAKPRMSLANAAEESGRQIGGDALLKETMNEAARALEQTNDAELRCLVEQQVMEAVKPEQSGKHDDNGKIESQQIHGLCGTDLDSTADSMTSSPLREVPPIPPSSLVSKPPMKERNPEAEKSGSIIDRREQLEELRYGAPDIELSINCKTAAIDVIKNLISRIFELDEAGASNIIAIMEHSPTLAADEILNTLKTQIKKNALGIPCGTAGKECSVSVRVTADFIPGSSPGELNAEGTITSRHSSPARNEDVLWLVAGDVLITQFCGDRGWAWGTCVRESDHDS
jgi:hypothetical protein